MRNTLACGLVLAFSLAHAQSPCPALDTLLATPKPKEAQQLAALECAPEAFAQMKNPSKAVIARALELDCRHITLVKNPDKKQLTQAIQRASDSAQCVAPLQQALGEKHKQWKALRKELPTRQPQALYGLYGVAGLSAAERTALFYTPAPLSDSACLALWDSAGAASLLPKDWKSRPFAFDSAASSCKYALADTLNALLDKELSGDTLRARLLAWFPERWQKRFGESATDAEKTRYVTHPALKDSSFCNYADWATPDGLIAYGVSNNSCAPYIRERFGSALFMLEFRKNYKPAVLSALLSHMGRLDAANLDSNRAFLDTLGLLLGSVESWEVTDTLQARSLELLSRVPTALRSFPEPTVPMIFSAANSDMGLLCSYPVTDRMLVQWLQERWQNELPMPSPEQQQMLSQCLSPEAAAAMQKTLEQIKAASQQP